MNAHEREWTQGPTDAPYDDDYVDLRVSVVHEQPRARRGAVVAMVAVVALVLAALGMTGRPLRGPSAWPAGPAAAGSTQIERAETRPLAARPE